MISDSLEEDNMGIIPGTREPSRMGTSGAMVELLYLCKNKMRVENTTVQYSTFPYLSNNKVMERKSQCQLGKRG